MGRYDGKYEVSSLGRVRVTATKQLKAQRESRRHFGSTFYFQGQRRTVWVHQLVAEAFIGARPEGEEVRHLDGNGLNNVPSNLAYGTHQQNIWDRREHGTNVNAHTNQAACKRGHEFVEENIYWTGPTRKRICKTCHKARDQWKRNGEWDYVNKCHISEVPKERLGHGATAPRPTSINRPHDSEESNN